MKEAEKSLSAINVDARQIARSLECFNAVSVMWSNWKKNERLRERASDECCKKLSVLNIVHIVRPRSLVSFQSSAPVELLPASALASWLKTFFSTLGSIRRQKSWKIEKFFPIQYCLRASLSSLEGRISTNIKYWRASLVHENQKFIDHVFHTRLPSSSLSTLCMARMCEKLRKISFDTTSCYSNECLILVWLKCVFFFCQ